MSFTEDGVVDFLASAVKYGYVVVGVFSATVTLDGVINTTQNVFTAMSRSLRKYVIVNQNLLCHLLHLADIMEREQFLTNSETRMAGNKLLDQAYKALLHISKASKDLSNVIKSSNFNNAPNTGYIGIICSEIGMQTTSIPIEVGEINTDNILASLSGNNNNNTQIIQTPKNVNNLNIPISELILIMLEVCLNSSQYGIDKDNSSKAFWAEIGKLDLLKPITTKFKPETLRKYWRTIREAKKFRKIIT